MNATIMAVIDWLKRTAVVTMLFDGWENVYL